MNDDMRSSLWKMLFKYKDAENRQIAIPLEERENDRKQLNEWYPEWERLPDLVADSQTLFFMIALKDAIHKNLLFDNIDPSERWKWFSNLVRKATYPVLHISSEDRNYEIKLKKIIHKNLNEQKQKDIVIDKVIEIDSLIKRKSINEEMIEKTKTELEMKFKHSDNKKEFYENLDLLEAQLFSQMISMKEGHKSVFLIKHFKGS
ncbi:MAG: hypothetical protein JXA60_09785 [Candidatus Coatesbacteria bacterium]|nr:hypothetical protein [Candidatus Coatesbacteria bacterium]